MLSNIKLFILLLLTLGITTPINSQDANNKLAFSVELNRKTYVGEAGNGLFNWVNYNIQPGVSANLYLNKLMDAGLSASYGSYHFQENATTSKGFKSSIFDPTFFLRFKFDNGLTIKENSAIGPYIKVGAGYNILRRDDTSTAIFNFMNVPLGAGLKFKLVPGLSIILESTCNFNFNDKYDGDFSSSNNDKYWNHKFGVVVGLNAGNDGDNDKDGIKNNKDRCPGTPAGTEVDEFGCPKISLKETDEVKLIAKEIYFETNSANIKIESNEALDRVVFLLKKFPGAKVVINGHTDNTGTPEYNLSLSQNRANAVKQYLVRSGIKSSRITTAGFGETVPLDTNDTPEGRAINRRVEFVFSY